jgi:ribonuclease R
MSGRGRGRGREDRQPQKSVEGRIQHKGTFAFLISEVPGQDDLYLGGPTVKLAMDGDRVEARVTGERGGRRTGEILRIVTRARTTAVGMLRQVGRFWAIFPEGVPDDAGMEVLGFAKGIEPRAGVLAALRIDRWPTEFRGPGGTVTEILGSPSEPGTRRKAVLAARDIPTEFPEETLEEAAALPLDPSESDWAGRKVLFDLPIFTIDGADAKDFDDAVSLEALANGTWRLGVHIASVADYVKRGTSLDDEAVRRGTSIYLPGKVIPMLPPKLSDHLCSLRPDVPRLTMTCWLHLDAGGNPGRVDLEETVIRSWRRFTYEEVQDVLDGKPVERVVPEVQAVVLKMGALAKKLTAARMKRGALDMSVPEYQIKVDPDGNPLAVSKRARLDSHRLIEEFMVAANEAVARSLTHARAPFIRRIHDDPDPEKLQSLQEEMGKLGIKASTSIVAHPVEGLQSLLKNAIGHPFEETANIQVIRSMKLAKYSSEPGGHFGLASKDYCHFTSPIRRYPDLVVHRAVKSLLRGKPREHAENLDMEKLAMHCSDRERVATEAERKSIDLARATLMGREIGRIFDAVIVGIAPIGVFVALPESGASGVWKGGTGTLGAKLKMRLIAADEILGRLEFEPVKDENALHNPARVSPWHRPGGGPKGKGGGGGGKGGRGGRGRGR